MARPRVLISTDIAGSDKDDAQSLIHALLYANQVNYRGFVATRSDDGGVVNGEPTNSRAAINQITAAYGDDLGNLRSHDPAYPSEAALRALVKTGAKDATWPGQLSEGARHIIAEARQASPADPLYLLGWGPIHDIAAALRAAPEIVSNVRVISIAGLGQDIAHPQAYNWMVNSLDDRPVFEDLWWLDIKSSFYGMYLQKGLGKVASINSHLNWVKSNVDDHGTLGELFYNRYTFNIHVNQPSSKSPDGLKMGDSPSLLYLLDAVNNNNPSLSSWGGSYKRTDLGTDTWSDRTGAQFQLNDKDGALTVYNKRAAVLADFAERLDWANTRAGSSAGESGPARYAEGPIPAQPEGRQGAGDLMQAFVRETEPEAFVFESVRDLGAAATVRRWPAEEIDFVGVEPSSKGVPLASEEEHFVRQIEEGAAHTSFERGMDEFFLL